MKTVYGIAVAFGLLCSNPSLAIERPSIGTPPLGVDHKKYAPPADIERVFRAFIVSFDSKDDDNEDGVNDILRVPHWVAQEIQRWEPPVQDQADISSWCIDTLKKRPKWFTDKELFASGVAGNDDSYRNSGFERGHMAMKLLAERYGQAAAYNTHSVLNAVPQYGKFNKGIWQKLEYLTGAWAQTYGRVWVIQGPVFIDAPLRWIGEESERKIAVPDAVFKIVVRQKTYDEKASSSTKTKDDPEVLAFLLPQLGPTYYLKSSHYRHEMFLTSVDEIEVVTGLDFPFGSGDKAAERRIERTIAGELWEPRRVNLKDKKTFINGCRSTK